MSTTVPAPHTAAAPAEKSMQTLLSPAERAIAFLALAEVCKAEADAAKQEAVTAAAASEAKTFKTDFGNLTIAQKDAPINVDDEAMLRWARRHHAQMVETVEQVRPQAAKDLRSRLTIVEGKVYLDDELPAPDERRIVRGRVRRLDGTLVKPVPFATVGDRPAPYASWPSSPAKKTTQERIRATMLGERDTLAARMLEAAK